MLVLAVECPFLLAHRDVSDHAVQFSESSISVTRDKIDGRRRLGERLVICEKLVRSNRLLSLSGITHPVVVVGKKKKGNEKERKIKEPR